MVAILPPLRQELALFPAPPSLDGTPVWTLHDPAANRFYQLGWAAFEMLSRWSLGTPEAVVAAVNRETTLHLTEDDLLAVIAFLDQNFLLDPCTARAGDRLLSAWKSRRPGWATWLLHNYLFIRIPLVRPQRLLNAAAPCLSWIYSGQFAALTALAALIAFYLISRQWDLFLHSFTAYRSLEGLLAVTCAIPFAKIIHEFGHALTAHRFGCRVPTMGIALVVMTPMLYTDTNEAWKLTSHRQRLSIGIAGIAAELLLALAALWAWLLLPDGPLRSAMFILATTTWIMTIALNASPFMRFDGYFILSDLLGIPNLHARSFAFGRWWLRELLFRLEDPQPEPAAPGRRRFLVLFALTVWVYRLTVFFGIALLVYHYFFKVLGIFLFAVEIGWFILLPLYKETQAWWNMRRRIRLNTASLRTVLLITGMVAIVALPMPSRIPAPSVLSFRHEQQLSAPFPSMVTREPAAAMQRVRQGENMAQLAAPDLEQRIKQVGTSNAVSRWQVAQQAFDDRLLSQGWVPLRKLEGSATELAGLQEEKQRLNLRAPFDGVIVARNDELTPGLWLPGREMMYVIADPRENRVDSYVSERELERIRIGAAVRFFPDAAEFGTFSCRVAEIDRVNVPIIDEAFLASTYGGPVAARNDSQGMPLPDAPLFRVRMDGCFPAEVPPIRLRGIAHIDAGKRILLREWLKSMAALAVRESGL